MKRTHLATAGLSMLAVMVVACSDAKGSSGTEPTTTSTPPTFCQAAATAEAVAQLPQQLLSGTDPAPPAAVQAVVEEFGDRFAEMVAVAPADIKSDVTVINQAAQELVAVVRAANYDLAKMTAADIAPVTATFSSTDYQAAQSQFVSYIAANCGAAPTTTGA
ncbi:MAG TPA: hypothetical protein VIH06_00065 [Ilumatobacteraceae bacterium]